MDTYNHFQESKSAISSLGYGIRRLMEFESVWISSVLSYEDKILMGLCIGYDGEGLASLSSRLKEMIDVEPRFFPASFAYKNYLDSLCNESNEKAIFSSISNLTEDFIGAAQGIYRMTHPLYDAATRTALLRVIQAMELKKDFLRASGFEGSFPPVSVLTQDKFSQSIDEENKMPRFGEAPTRPENLVIAESHILNLPEADLTGTVEGIRRILHFLMAEIEVPATEVCARNIADYGRNMPISFSTDMARQCLDEARHALMVQNAAKTYNVALGDYSYTNKVWNSYNKGEGLSEKLAIQQVIDEGNGNDGAVHSLPKFVKAGFRDIQAVYEFLIADETVHCGYGNKWLMYLAENKAEVYEAILKKALEKINGKMPGFAPVDAETRRAAQYPEWLIARNMSLK